MATSDFFLEGTRKGAQKLFSQHVVSLSVSFHAAIVSHKAAIRLYSSGSCCLSCLYIEQYITATLIEIVFEHIQSSSLARQTALTLQ